jgi:hypothetical protein
VTGKSSSHAVLPPGSVAVASGDGHNLWRHPRGFWGAAKAISTEVAKMASRSLTQRALTALGKSPRSAHSPRCSTGPTPRSAAPIHTRPPCSSTCTSSGTAALPSSRASCFPEHRPRPARTPTPLGPGRVPLAKLPNRIAASSATIRGQFRGGGLAPCPERAAGRARTDGERSLERGQARHCAPGPSRRCP